MAFTFKGGIRLDEHKNTARSPIVPITAPSVVRIPLSQHISTACVPCVKVGDLVCKGQVIGQTQEGEGCLIHASVSGKILEISSITDAQGRQTESILIENDFEDRLSDASAACDKDLRTLTPEQIVEHIRLAGIFDAGTTPLPAFEKLSHAIGKADKLIVNCTECEPYVTANHRLLLEHPEQVVGGIKILLRALSLRKAYIAIEDNKRDAVKAIAKLDFDPEMIRICIMKSKYPQGDEGQIIYALTGKELPFGKPPADIGCVLFGAETCAAIYNAFAHGEPLIRRIVTVDGDGVDSPGNLLVPIGTPVSDLIRFCDGELSSINTIISGGPMRGQALCDTDSPITKDTCAILAFSKKQKRTPEKEGSCIRCGKCVESCPMQLVPRELYRRFKKNDLTGCEKYGVLSCTQCGVCSYVCPARLELTSKIGSAQTLLRSAPKKDTASPESSESERKEQS
ncbi:MAG: electron transport complex subunit RsxC [Clostridia bacterium]|nr:electron transport complex subunit RsxC [Clostridia bacterium]